MCQKVDLNETNDNSIAESEQRSEGNVGELSIGNELGDMLDANRSNLNHDDVPNVSNTSIDTVRAKMLKEDHAAINQLMLTTLSPQLNENETQKRQFKEKLMKYIQIVLIIQLIVVGVSFLAIIVSVCFGVSHKVFVDNLGSILNFLQYYITAIIVEFIAMLFFIVKFVFDKSIVELLSNTIDKKNKKNKTIKQ